MTTPTPPKKKRKLFIVDPDEVPAFDTTTLGPIHAQLQAHIISVADSLGLAVEDMPDEIWLKADKVLSATSADEANKLIQEASELARQELSKKVKPADSQG